MKKITADALVCVGRIRNRLQIKKKVFDTFFLSQKKVFFMNFFNLVLVN